MSEVDPRPRYQAFAMIPVECVTDTDLTHAEFRAISAVAVHRNTKTGWSWPSHATLARDLGLAPGPASEERVRQLLSKPIRKGYIDRVPGVGRTRSLYRVVLDHQAPTEAEIAAETPPSETKGAAPYEDETPMFPRGLAPYVSKGSDPYEAKGCTRREDKDESLDESDSPKPPHEPTAVIGTADLFPPTQVASVATELTVEGARKKGAKKAGTILEGEVLGPERTSRSDSPAGVAREFEAFWAAYPRRDDKGHARPAFQRALTKATPQEILDGVARYQFSPNPKFIPLPATWLNGERWAAEIDDFDPVLRAAGLTPDDFINGRLKTPAERGRAP